MKIVCRFCVFGVSLGSDQANSLLPNLISMEVLAGGWGNLVMMSWLFAVERRSPSIYGFVTGRLNSVLRCTCGVRIRCTPTARWKTKQTDERRWRQSAWRGNWWRVMHQSWPTASTGVRQVAVVSVRSWAPRISKRWLSLAITWKFCWAPIPAIFVSYPNPELKRFQKEFTTIYSVLSFSDWIMDCAWQTYTFLAVRFVYISCLNVMFGRVGKF